MPLELPSDGPSLIRVDEKAYDQAVRVAVARTGMGHAEVQWMLQGVFASAMMAPPELFTEDPSVPGNELEPLELQEVDCPWGYLTPAGQLVMCHWMPPGVAPDGAGWRHNPRKPGWHEGPTGTFGFYENHPRALNVAEWKKGETAS